MYITSKLLLIYRTWTKSNHNSRTSLKYNLVWSFLCSPCRLSVYFAEWNNNSNMLFCKKDIIQNKKEIAHQTCKYQRTFLSCYSDNNSWRNKKTFSKTRDILFHKTWNMSHFQASIGVKKTNLSGLCPNPTGRSRSCILVYLATFRRLCGRLPSPKFNSCISPWQRTIT